MQQRCGYFPFNLSEACMSLTDLLAEQQQQQQNNEKRVYLERHLKIYNYLKKSAASKGIHTDVSGLR